MFNIIRSEIQLLYQIIKSTNLLNLRTNNFLTKNKLILWLSDINNWYIRG